MYDHIITTCMFISLLPIAASVLRNNGTKNELIRPRKNLDCNKNKIDNKQTGISKVIFTLISSGLDKLFLL